MKVSALGAVPFVIPHDRNLQLLALCVPGCVGSLHIFDALLCPIIFCHCCFRYVRMFIYEKTNIVMLINKSAARLFPLLTAKEVTRTMAGEGSGIELNTLSSIKKGCNKAASIAATSFCGKLLDRCS